MKVIVFTLALSVAGSTLAFAGDTLLASAVRAARQLARTDAPPIVAASAGANALSAQAAQATQQPSGLAAAGLSRRSKTLIAIGAAVAFGGVAYAIDRHVVNNTPSTLGTRKD